MALEKACERERASREAAGMGGAPRSRQCHLVLLQHERYRTEPHQAVANNTCGDGERGAMDLPWGGWGGRADQGEEDEEE